MPPLLPHSPTYRTAKGYRLLLYVLAPPLMLLFLAMPWLMRHDSAGKPVDTAAWLLLSAVALGLVLLFVFGLLDTAKGYLALTPTTLRQVGVFKTKELAFDDIKGFRRNDKYLFIFPKTADRPKIKIAYTVERFKELGTWLESHFPDLDQVDTAASLAAALAREELGRNPEERADQLAQARRTALALNVAGGAVAAWLLLFPQYYQWAVAASLVVPLLAAAALWWHQGVLRLDDASNTAYPSIFVAVGAPSLALILRALFDVEFVNYPALWAVVAQVGIGTALLLALGTRSWLFDGQTALKTVLVLLVLSAMYGYGASAMVDTAFDTAPGQRFHTQVLDKRTSHGKTTTYYLTVAPWGPVATTEDVQVDSDLYEATRPGSQATVHLRPGRLGVPWFVVEW